MPLITWSFAPSRLHKLGATLLLLLLCSAVFWPWLTTTLPRWAVAHWLAGQLDAEVTLDELRIETKQRFLLRGLTVDLPEILPEVEQVTVDEMLVEATLEQLLAGHLDALRLRGVRLRLRPAPPSSTAPAAATPTIAELHLEPAQVTVTSMDGAERARFTLRAEITDFGGIAPGTTAHGHIAVTAEELSLRPLAELARVELPETLAATLENLTVELWHAKSGDRLDLRATAVRATLAEDTVQGEDLIAELHHRDGTLHGNLATRRLHGVLAGFPFDLPSPSLSLTAQPADGDDGLLQLDLEPQVPGLGQARIAALVHPGEGGWRELDATLKDTRWDELWPALGLEAESDLRLFDDGRELRIDVEIRSPRIHRPEIDLVLEDAVLTFQGLTPHPPDLNELPTSLEVRSLALTLGGGHLGGYSLPHHLRAEGRLRGSPRWPVLRAEFLLTEIELFPAGPHHLKLHSLRLDLTSSQVTDLSRLKVRALHATGELGLPPRLPALPFTLHAAGHPLPDAGFELESALLELRDLADLECAGRWRPAADGGRAHLKITGIDLARWQALLGAAEPGFAVAGKGAAELEARLGLDGHWQLSGPAHLRDAGFASTDGSRVMEGLSSDLELLVEGTGQVPRSATATGQAGGFVLLWGTFFGDFLDLSSQIEIRAEVGADLSDWRLSTHLHLPGIFDLQADLERRPAAPEDELRFGLVLTAEDLRSAQRELLARFEGLEDLDVGGHLELQAEGRFRAADRWTAEGDLTLSDLRWTGDQATVEGLDLHLPLALERRGAEFSGRRQLGHLRFDRLALRDLEVPPIASALWVEADSLGLVKPLEVPVFGGRVVLEGLGASHLLREDRYAESGLQLEAIDLARIAAELGLFPLEGTLDGDFPRLVLRGDDLEIDGGGRVSLFGGTVEVRDIRGEDLFTPFPELILSADLRNIDLGRLTRRIEFGEMTGILHGSIENCRLFRGVPVTCRATFRTEERPGVKRTVDIKAVNNLTILGTGQGTNVLDRGVQRFLKRFTYAAMGVELLLADDILLLRGLERRGERELFLRGRLPFPIDIVNAQPGGAVSFQAMLRRLESLDFSQVETSPP